MNLAQAVALVLYGGHSVPIGIQAAFAQLRTFPQTEVFGTANATRQGLGSNLPLAHVDNDGRLTEGDRQGALWQEWRGELTQKTPPARRPAAPLWQRRLIIPECGEADSG